MSTDQTEYELFISYARLDNKPIPETHSHGWVTAVRDFLIADQRKNTAEPLRIFFDTVEIRDLDDWRNRILGGLRSSKILLVCLSPSYEKSEPCLWEWHEYLKHQTHQLMGGESIGTVYFADVARSPDPVRGKRHDELMKYNFTDIRKWFAEGPQALDKPEVHSKLEALGLSMWERIERARRARSVPGNVRRSTQFFVGRREELARLHAGVGVGAIGVVTAVHGLGGMGKTELAYHYANGYADGYPVGLWSLAAEGKKELLPLIGELAFVPQFTTEFSFTPTDTQKNDPNLLGAAVLDVLRRRSEALKEKDREKGAAALIVLDNVSEPELLGVTELSKLPQSANWLRLVATTRLGPERLARSEKQLATVAIDSLSEEDALRLVRLHQPDEEFPNAAEEAAAREIVRELGGFTLAVEQVAIHLGVNAGIESPTDYLKRLRADGLPSVDELVGDTDIAIQMLHQEKQLAPILRATLVPLARELPAAITALKFASLLPPDTVPWPWLQVLTTLRHPELRDKPLEWARLERRLKGLRLLTDGEPPEFIARIHRLVGAHLRKETDEALASALREYASRRCYAIQQSLMAPDLWELDALLETVPFLLAIRSDRDLAVQGIFLIDKLITYRSLTAAYTLLTPTHAVISRLAESDPGNAPWQRDLSVSLEKRGEMAVALGNLPEAQRLFNEALLIAQRLADSDPANAAWQHDLTVLLDRHGNMAVALGNLSEAQRLFGESLQIRQRLAGSDTTNTIWQRDLAVSLIKVGNVAVDLGNLAEAQRLFNEALLIAQRLADSDPGNAAWQRNLAQAHCWVGNVLAEQGNLSAAMISYQAFHHTMQCLAESDPSNTEWQRDLYVSLNKLGEVAVAQKMLPDAQRLFSESLLTAERMADSDPGNVRCQRDLCVALNRLGHVAVSLENLPEAQRLFSESLRIAQRLADSDPTHAQWQRDLSAVLTDLGDVAEALGNLTEAHRHSRDSLRIRQRLADADPGNVAWQRDLCVSHTQIAHLKEKCGEPDAMAHWQQAHDILSRLVKMLPNISPEDIQYLEQLRAKIGG
jgi:tetratricopeptide (TPR) repeat protein